MKRKATPPSREAFFAWLKEREKPEIRIQYEKAQQPLPVGASKIGGCPDVPAGFEWPRFDASQMGVPGKGIVDSLRGVARFLHLVPEEKKQKETKLSPLAFMAQFDLAEVAAFDSAGLLPRAGHLAFFYDYENLPYGALGDKDKAGARVFYFPPGTALLRMEPPDELHEKSRLPEQQLRFSAGISRAPTTRGMPDEIYSDELNDEYYDGELEGWDDFKLLGNASTIQDTMEEQCQMLAMGLDWKAFKNPHQKAAIEAGAADWILLLQLGSIWDGNGKNKKIAMMFGDSGAIYYWIRKQDLAACCFDDVRIIMQCC